jgi:perosamine synthetase
MSWFVYVVRLDERYDRQRVIEMLGERGVPGRPYFEAIHLQPYYTETLGCRPGMLPVTERISRQTMALPFFSNMEEREVDYVCETLEEVLRAQ